MRSPYPAVRVPVRRTTALPGAPRERASNLHPVSDRQALRAARSLGSDQHARTGVNLPGTGSVWGSRVAPVTGRKARKSPGWTSVIAGGQYIEAPGV